MGIMDLAQTLNLEVVVGDRQRLVAMRKEIDAQIEDATDTIKEFMILNDLTACEIGDVTASLTVREGRATLDRMALVSLGVGTDVIERATKHGKPYTQLDIRERAA